MDAPAPGPRRSRRGAAQSAKAAATPVTSADGAGAVAASAPLSAAPAPPQRRSERHAKAVGAATADRRDGAPDADGGVGARDRRRTRASSSPARGAPSPSPPPTAPSSPTRSSSRTANTSAADSSPALSSTPNRRRRPASRATDDAHAGSDARSRAGGHSRRVLGKYSARECALLCEVILEHVRRNSLAADVLARECSPAVIHWDKVAKRMLKTHRLDWTPRECQTLWKFLAYAQAPIRETEEGEEEEEVVADAHGSAELLPASDEEDIERPIHEIQARCQDVREVTQTSRELFASASAPPPPRHRDTDTAISRDGAANLVETTQAAVIDSASGDAARSTPVREVRPPPAVRLYPTYELPPGALDEPRRPFNPKQTLPLTFVAQKFLKKREAPALKDSPATKANTSTTAVATASSTLPSTISSSSNAAPSPSSASTIAAVTSAEAPKPAVKRLSSESLGTSSVAAQPPKKKSKKVIKPLSTSSSSQPRAPFVPSTTPPPAPIPAKTELDFFRLVHAQVGEGSGAASPTLEELAELYRVASPAIQQECKKLAMIDGERFNREYVRRRIWEKAMGSVSRSNAALPSPIVGAGVTARADATVATMANSNPNGATASANTSRDGSQVAGAGAVTMVVAMADTGAPSSG